MAAPEPVRVHAPVAALRAAPGIGDLLATFARAVEEEGYVVRGLIQCPRTGVQGSRRGLDLVDMHSGRRYAITQELGPGSCACRVDPQGIAEASAVLRNAIDERADLVVVNRFGKLETHGAGLAAEMLAVMAAGIPLLTMVDEMSLGRWQAFTGGSLVLTGEFATLWHWWRTTGRRL